MFDLRVFTSSINNENCFGIERNDIAFYLDLALAQGAKRHAILKHTRIYKLNVHLINRTNNQRPNGNSDEETRARKKKHTHSPSLKVDNNKKRFVGTIALPWLFVSIYNIQTENQWFWMCSVFNVSNLFVIFSFLFMIFAWYKTTIWCLFGLSPVLLAVHIIHSNAVDSIYRIRW